jgi:hypothetical protein
MTGPERKELMGFQPKLERVILATRRKAVEEAGAPWSPGRMPEWNN